MNEWFSLSTLLFLVLIGVFFAIYPLRKYKLFIVVVIPISLTFLIVGYGVWGDFFGLQAHLFKQIKSQEVQSILKSPQRTETLIQTMIQRLDKTPKSTQGWYLVGKLYLSQKQYKKACDTLGVAYELNSNDTKIGVLYAQSLWELHHQQFERKSRKILHHVLKINPNQSDALAMLAMDAYTMHHEDQAIEYWERLLVLMPEDSKEFKAIQEAIVKTKRG
jgi:cytochrome c-type biogenesis protein CcmH/NrfG